MKYDVEVIYERQEFPNTKLADQIRRHLEDGYTIEGGMKTIVINGVPHHVFVNDKIEYELN